jgi:hypothetical protein
MLNSVPAIHPEEVSHTRVSLSWPEHSATQLRLRLPPSVSR